MRRILAGCLLAGLLLLACPGPVLAWNKAGHMVTAAIAYNVLKADAPEVLARTVTLLKAHPQFRMVWQNDLAKVPAEDQDLYLFMLAARWADDIRGNATYDHPTWHYINYPFKPPGQPDSVVVPPANGPVVNIVQAYDQNRKALLTAPDDGDKAVAICWLFHLIGDIQQPLHAVALFSTDYPQGDRGGTRFYVRVTAGSRPINLHAFWDDLVQNSDRFTDAKNRATELRLRPEFAADKLQELSEVVFENWAKNESFALAKSSVYRDGKIVGSPIETAAVALPADYPKATKPLAERRAVLAGHRIAQVLRGVFDPVPK